MKFLVSLPLASPRRNASRASRAGGSVVAGKWLRSRVRYCGRIGLPLTCLVVYPYGMNRVVKELDRRLKQFDPATAERVERLVLDALALAGEPAKSSASSQWPDGYFEETAGALAGERFERPEQGGLPTREAW